MKTIPEFEIYIRFFETDAAGHVNNISYYIYMEEARTRFFDYIGLQEVRKEYPYLQLLVASSHCNYHKQAHFRQRIKASTKVSRVGTKSFSTEYEIRDVETEDLIATGGAVMVCFHREKQHAIEIPMALRSLLEEYV